MNNPQPVQLVIADSQNPQNLIVNQEGLDQLRKIRTRVAVVSVAGAMRSGKSLILNMLNGTSTGFKIGTTNLSQTKGIWLWPLGETRKLKFCKEDGREIEEDVTIVLLDTEGLGDLNNSGKYDNKLISLSIMLSSLFIYNSFGTIKTDDLEKLGFITSLVQNIKIDKNARTETGAQFNMYFPDFVWLLRDWILEIVFPEGHPKHGQPCSEKEWFDALLTLSDSEDEHVKHLNDIRRQFHKFFPSRGCFTMPIPAEAPEDVREIESRPHKMTQQFRTKCEEFKKQILERIRPKVMKNVRTNAPHVVTGSQFAELVRASVAEVNAGVPSFSGLYDSVVSSTCSAAVDAACQLYTQQMDGFVTQFGDNPIEHDQLTQFHNSALKAALQLFHEKSFGSDSEIENFHKDITNRIAVFEEKLVEELKISQNDPMNPTRQQVKRRVVVKGLFFQFITTNQTKSEQFCNTLATEYLSLIANKLTKRDYDYNQFSQDANIYTAEYLQKAKGPAKHKIYGNFVRNLSAPESPIQQQIQMLKGFQKEMHERNMEMMRIQNEQKTAQEMATHAFEQSKAFMAQQTEMFVQMQERNSVATRELLTEMRQMQEDENKRRTEMEERNMRNIHESMQRTFNGHQESMKTMVEMMGKNHQQLLAQSESMTKALQALANRPPPVVHVQGGCCFPACAQVRLENGDIIPIAKLKNGDRVATADDNFRVSYSTVYYTVHKDGIRKMVRVYYMIGYEGQEVEKFVCLTPDHLIYATPTREKKWHQPVSASLVKKGDYVWVKSEKAQQVEACQVSRVESSEEYGRYTVHLMNNSLLVDDVLCSAFEINQYLLIVDALPLVALHHLAPSMLERQWFQSMMSTYDDTVEIVLKRIRSLLRWYSGTPDC